MITAFIFPYRDDRTVAREILGPERFIETYLAADLSVCERRDPRGLYKKVRLGQILALTGISAHYEAPDELTITIDSGLLTVEDGVLHFGNTVLPCLRDGHVGRQREQHVS